MSRSTVPSQVQVQKLLDCLVKKPWLATGHARTSHARDRTRTAWQDIAVKLNADGSGCIKTWQQWAKYFKDKKAATKKKVNQIQMARQRTGGGVAEEVILSAIEERITALMGGEGFAVADRELEINPFNLSTNVATGNSQNMTPEGLGTLGVRSLQEPIAQIYEQSLGVEPVTAGVIQTEQSAQSLPDVQPTQAMSLQPSLRNIQQDSEEHREIREENQLNVEQVSQATSPPPAVPSRRNASIASSSPHRRRVISRRHLIQRSPPSQMASLTERFIAIEERRLETERILAENQRNLINVFQQMTEAWAIHSRALQDLVQYIRN